MIEYWAAAAINPWASYTEDFRLVAMDQRNAGQSRGPLDVGDPWGAYAADQLGLLDHLEIDRFLVCDAQTSGGLFVSLPAERAEGLPWPVIGRLVEGVPGTVAVR